MSEKCFCHLNGYEVKDASARRGLEVKQDKILFFDSLDQVPADLPEGSFVAVPSEESAGGGGLPVVKIATRATVEGAELTTDEAAEMDALNGRVAIFDFYAVSDGVEIHFQSVALAADIQGMFQYTVDASVFNIDLTNMSGSWTIELG